MECKFLFALSDISIIAELIETLWNVNEITEKDLETALRINRNIVECKLYHSWFFRMLWHRINRNIVECKFI